MRRNKSSKRSRRTSTQSKLSRLFSKSYSSAPSLALLFEALEDRRMLAALTPAQVIKAYGVDQLMYGNVKGNGAGQTIAIIDGGDDSKFVDSTNPGFAASDLGVFDSTYGLTDPPSFRVVGENGQSANRPTYGGPITSAIESNIITAGASTVTITTTSAHGFAVGDTVNVTGVGINGYNGFWTITAVPTTTSFQYSDTNTGLGNSSGGQVANPVDSAETAGDIEWAHTIAPAANIVLIEMSSFFTQADIVRAIQIGVPAVSAAVVSMSFGGLEYPGQTGASTLNDSVYTGSGITYVDDSGDNSSPGWYSSYSPNVLGVGATNLFTNPDGSYNYETGWSGRAPIATLTESGNTVTVNLSFNFFSFSAGQSVRIAGASMPGYDGTFTINTVDNPANTSSFTYTDPTGGLANAVGGAAVIIPGNIDDGDAGFSTTGSWTTQTGGYNNDYETAPAGTATATWNFSAPKNVNLGMELTWTAAAGNATNASYRVYDGAVNPNNLLFTIRVDQSVAVIDNTGTQMDATIPFQKLRDFFQSTTGTINIVENGTGDANGTLVADDIMLSIDNNFGGSGGGISQFESQPSYQNGKVNGISSTQRLVPDVAWLGGGETPVQIVDTLGGNTTFAGTSLATPMWAALVAVVDQGRVLAGLGTISSSDPTNGIQALLYNEPASDFHDVIAGYNGYSALTGYDLVTGLGTPNFQALVPDLAGADINYTVPTTASPHELVLRKNNDNVELLDNGVVVESVPVEALSNVNITDNNATADRLTVDYEFDGFFAAKVDFDHTTTDGYQTVRVLGPNGGSHNIDLAESTTDAGKGAITVDDANHAITTENVSEVDIQNGDGGDHTKLEGAGGNSGWQRVYVTGGAADDTLTVDSTNGLASIPNGIYFDGAGGFNQLNIQQTAGTTQTTERYVVGPNNGEGSDVIVGPSGNQTIYFHNLAPVVSNTPVTTFTVVATPADNAINYTHGSTGTTGLITIDEQESYEFSDKVHLIIDSGAGSDEINLRNASTPSLLADITVNGDDPTASDTVIVNGTALKDTINFSPTAIDAGAITGAGPVPITLATVEHLIINGQGGDDALTITTPTGNDLITLNPGPVEDQGSVTIRRSNPLGGSQLLGVDYLNLGGNNGTLTFADTGGRTDFLTYNPVNVANSSDIFTVNSDGSINYALASSTGAQAAQVGVLTPGIFALTLNGLGGDDFFNVPGNHPFTGGIFVNGGDSGNDTLNFTGINAAVTVDLTASTITELSLNPVQYIGIEKVTLTLPSQPLVVTGTAGDDTINFTPTSANAGSFTASSTGAFVSTSPLFTYTGAGPSIAVDGGSGGFDTLGIIATNGNDTINAVQGSGSSLSVTLNAFTVQFSAIHSIKAADISALGGNDVIRVSVADALETLHPETALRFDVDGGAPNANDRLIVNDDGLGDLDLWRQNDDNNSGSVTIGVFAPVNYVNVERVDITPVDPITGGTGSDGDGRIKIFHTDPFEYNDTLPNAAQLQRIGDDPNSPNIDPAGIPAFGVAGDQDWYTFRPQATGTYQVGILFKTLATLANGRPGLPGNGDLNLEIYDANGNLITTGTVNSDGSGKTATFAATNDPNFSQFNTIYVRVIGATADSINDYDFNNIAGLITGMPAVSAADLEGPQVTDVRISDPTTAPNGTNGENLNYNLFGLKSGNAAQGPTPLVNAITVNFQDLPARFPGFLYPAIDYKLTADQARGLFSVVGDANGQIDIKEVIIHNDGVTLGGVPTGEIQIIFAKALPDDRFTLTISDSLRDPAQNKLDGESNAAQPNNGPFLPSGDGHSGGDFVARFTVDTRPELGDFAAARVYVDINGNSIYDPTNTDATNRDLIFTMQLDPTLVGRAQLGVHDSVFVGNFANSRGVADGFSKLGLYGTDPVAGVGFRWLLDTDDNGTADLLSFQATGFTMTDQNGASVKFTGVGIAFAGNFDGNAANGDEIGLFDGTHFFLDTNHNNVIDAGDTVITTALRGTPIVGDFNGDGAIDLGTWQNDVFQFNFGVPGTGGNTGNPIQFSGAVDATINFGFPGVGEVPIAADMDHDGITDIGLWVPGRAGSSTADIAETYFLISNDFDANGLPRNTGLTDPTAAFSLLNHAFSPTPLGTDMYSNFLDEFATPIVGNFDPPVVPNNPQLDTDTTPPTSSVSSLASTQTSRGFNVSWSGTDTSGIAGYDVYVSDNGGAFTQWQSDTTNTSAVFTGVNGHTYGFFSVATDKAGNVQNTPSRAQATSTISIRSLTTTVLTTSNSSVVPGQNVGLTATVSAVDTTNPVPAGTVTFKDGSTVLSTVALVNGTATLNTANLAAGNHNITATYNATAPSVGSVSTTLVEHIVSAALEADPTNPALTALFVGGSTGNDIITLAAATGGGYTVSISNTATKNKATSLGTFKPSGHVYVYGLGGTDTLVAPNVANTWNITGANAGTLDGIAFDSFENLTGGSLADVFHMNVGGSVSGKIAGGSGANTLDYSAYAAANSVNLQTSAATGVASFAGIANVVGSASSTLVGPNKSNTWNITGANAGNVAGVSFTGIANLTGGTSADTFSISSAASIGRIDAGAGTDSLKYLTSGTVNLASASATGVGSFANLEGMIGGTGIDTLIGLNQANTWSISNSNTGKVNSFTFSGVENLTGGSQNDNFVLAKAKGVTGHIDGGAGANMLDYAAYTTAVNVNLATGSATNITGGVTNISVVRGGSANDILVGDSGNDALIGGAGNDTLTAGSGHNLLFGGAGADTLNGGAGQDILFSGTTKFDSNLATVDTLLAYWARTDLDYGTRVSALKAGSVAGVPALNATNVVNDAVVNSLNGGSGLDWFFAKLSGKVTDKITNFASGEQEN